MSGTKSDKLIRATPTTNNDMLEWASNRKESDGPEYVTSSTKTLRPGYAAPLGGSAPDGKGTSLAAVGAGLERLLQEAEMAGPTNSSQDLTPLSAGLVARCQEACLLQHYAIAPCTYFDLAAWWVPGNRENL